MQSGARRGPVIERAREPGTPRGALLLIAAAAVGGGLYWSGYSPETGAFDRMWRDATRAVSDFWNESPKPTPPPSQTARAPIAPAPRSSPPTPAPANPAPAMRPSQPAPGQLAPLPPAPPPAPDVFREAFKRDVLGQFNAPTAAPTPPPQPAPVAPSEPARSSIFPRPPGAGAPSPFAPEIVDRFVEEELNRFNASRDVPLKREAMQKVVAAAQIGHGPARGVIVRGYPVSTIIRDVVAPADAVRFALDFIIHKRAFSNDARRDFIALAAWFDGERKDAAFGEAIFDAIRDDPRLQSSDAINDLMFLLYRAERGCIALRRHINVFDPNTQNVGHCGADLSAATPGKARAAGPVGGEPARFRAAVEALTKALGSPT